MSNYQIQDLPNELLLKVQDYMETKDQIRFGQLSKRFRAINETMWQKVNLCEMIVPVGFIEMILNQKCQYLSLYRAKMEGSSNLRIKSNELKYLDLSACDGNESFLEEILESCSSLEKLSMYNLKLSSKMISSICIQNGKTLKILDMEGCYGLDLEAIKLIVQNCVELTEVNFANTRLSDDSFQFLVNNLTRKVEKLNLSRVIGKQMSSKLLTKQGCKVLCSKFLSTQIPF